MFSRLFACMFCAFSKRIPLACNLMISIFITMGAVAVGNPLVFNSEQHLPVRQINNSCLLLDTISGPPLRSGFLIVKIHMRGTIMMDHKANLIYYQVPITKGKPPLRLHLLNGLQESEFAQFAVGTFTTGHDTHHPLDTATLM